MVRAFRAVRSNLLAKDTKQFHVVHDPDPVTRTELQHVWFVKVPIYRADHIGCSRERRIDHRVIVGAFEYDRWAFGRGDDLAQRFQVLNMFLNVSVRELVNGLDTRVLQNPPDLADETSTLPLRSMVFRSSFAGSVALTLVRTRMAVSRVILICRSL